MSPTGNGRIPSETLGARLTDWWEKMLESRNDAHEEVLHRFGNLTLLEDIDNRGIKNDPFPDKQKNAYRKSMLPTNEFLQDGKMDGFGSAEMEAREKVLGPVADRTWALE